jgi:hypothetical protein
MLDHADILRLKKSPTVQFCALNRESRLDQFHLGGPLSGKSQKILTLATQNSSLEGSPMFGPIYYLLIFC